MERDLVTDEGVDEGSAAMSTEEPTDSGDLLGAAPARAGQVDAAPVPVGEDQPGPGQRQQVGEG